MAGMLCKFELRQIQTKVGVDQPKETFMTLKKIFGFLAMAGLLAR